jgi:tetratricopeptide (TPR) repeat protein
MATIITPYTHLTALIIDDMATQQTTLRGQLAMLGVSKVEQATTPDDAMRQIKAKRYNLILCDYNLNNKTDGQQLFEFARDNKLLAPDCLFFMVTAEGAYASVASATEHAPDAYLLKPITASDIEERLKTMLDKRQVLLPINQKLERDDLAGALAECDKVLAKPNRWAMQAIQTKGQCLLQLGRHEDAKAVYRAVLEQRPNLVWAELGLARAHKAAGQFEEAKMLAQGIIQSRDGEKNVAAYDVVAEALEAQGDTWAAQAVLRDAASVVPSARRHRLLGEVAYRNGDLDTAKESQLKVAKATKGSVVAQAQDTLSLAQTLVDRHEAQDAIALLAEGAGAWRNNPQFESASLAVKVQAQVRAGDPEGAARTLEKARNVLRKGKADFNTIALAKAELLCGHEEAGLKLLEAAVSADHENPRVKQMIGNALKETGHEDKIHQVIESAAAGLENRVKDARKLLRDSQVDEAIAAIEAAVKDYPENTGVLLQAAQINCMSLRLKKELNAATVERVRIYLQRLEKLMPANDRVTQMRRYFRETMGALQDPAPTAVNH